MRTASLYSVIDYIFRGSELDNRERDELLGEWGNWFWQGTLGDKMAENRTGAEEKRVKILEFIKREMTPDGFVFKLVMDEGVECFLFEKKEFRHIWVAGSGVSLCGAGVDPRFGNIPNENTESENLCPECRKLFADFVPYENGTETTEGAVSNKRALSQLLADSLCEIQRGVERMEEEYEPGFLRPLTAEKISRLQQNNPEVIVRGYHSINWQPIRFAVTLCAANTKFVADFLKQVVEIVEELTNNNVSPLWSTYSSRLNDLICVLTKEVAVRHIEKIREGESGTRLLLSYTWEKERTNETL